ncbi:hypothetical protein BDV96DRAFT_664079, partial [Lophiotrema nucula]
QLSSHITLEYPQQQHHHHYITSHHITSYHIIMPPEAPTGVRRAAKRTTTGSSDDAVREQTRVLPDEEGRPKRSAYRVGSASSPKVVIPPSSSRSPVATSSRAPSPKKRKFTLPDEPDWPALAHAIGHSTGYQPLAVAALRYAHRTDHTIAKDLQNHAGQALFNNTAGSIFCAMDRRALKALADGTYVDKLFSDEDFEQHVDHYDAQGRKQPCIYVRPLALADGSRPTVGDIRFLIRDLTAYIEESRTADERCFEIDSMYRECNKADYMNKVEAERYYLKSARSYRREVVRDFVKALEKHVNGLEDRDIFPFTIQYIGYCLNTVNREAQHSRTGGDNTGWLASLILSCMNYRFLKHLEETGDTRRNIEHGWKLHFHVIALLGHEKEAAIAEMLLACVARAYYWVGGLNVAKCGESVNSIRMENKTAAERKALWNSWSKFIMKETAWEYNLEHDAELSTAARESARKATLDAKRAGIAEKFRRLETFIQTFESLDLNRLDPAERAKLQKKYDDIKSTLKDLHQKV